MEYIDAYDEEKNTKCHRYISGLANCYHRHPAARRYRSLADGTAWRIDPAALYSHRHCFCAAAVLYTSVEAAGRTAGLRDRRL